jgi:dTDP-4-dehydrorhamnose reductase
VLSDHELKKGMEEYMIWIIGCNGMLGKELAVHCEKEKIAFVGTDRECDIADIKALRAFAEDKKIRWIINCSAYTAVDKAEDEEDLAFAINATGAGNIAEVASVIGAKMVHMSTDYVFDGKGARPYKEDDPVNPIGAYGRTKLAGEKLIQKKCANHFIIRTAWLYGKHGINFVHTMLRLFKERDTVNVVSDQRGTPTWAYSLVLAIIHIVLTNSNKYGIYHFTNEGETNWHEFAYEIYSLACEKGIVSKNVTINPVTTDKYPTKAKRPGYSVLDKTKIKSVLGVTVPEWKQSLSVYLQSYSKELS